MEPTWANQLDEARKLDDKELARHASVSTDNNHQCVDCFCCACVVVREERARAARIRKRLGTLPPIPAYKPSGEGR